MTIPSATAAPIQSQSAPQDATAASASQTQNTFVHPAIGREFPNVKMMTEYPLFHPTRKARCIAHAITGEEKAPAVFQSRFVVLLGWRCCFSGPLNPLPGYVKAAVVFQRLETTVFCMTTSWHDPSTASLVISDAVTQLTHREYPDIAKLHLKACDSTLFLIHDSAQNLLSGLGDELRCSLVKIPAMMIGNSYMLTPQMARDQRIVPTRFAVILEKEGSKYLVRDYSCDEGSEECTLTSAKAIQAKIEAIAAKRESSSSAAAAKK